MEIQVLEMVLNGPAVIVPLSPTEKLEVPDPIKVRVTNDHFEVDLVVRADRETLLPQVSEILRIKPIGRRGFTNDLWRSLGFGKVLEEVVRTCAQRYELEGDKWVSHWQPPFREPDAAEIRKVMTAGKRQVPHEDIERAAEVYREAVAAGRRDATKAVAYALNVSRPTAARRVEKARALGLLGASSGTKAGEA